MKWVLLVFGILIFTTGTVCLFWNDWVAQRLPPKLKSIEDRVESLGVAGLFVGAGLIMVSV